MLRLLLFYILILVSASVFSQEGIMPVKFGKVSKKDLAMTVYEQDSTAEAVVLCDYAFAHVRLFDNASLLETDYFRRLKILKRTAFDYGDISIPFYSYKNNEKFIFIQAMIHLPNGESIKVKAKDVFIEEMSQYWSRATFSFPGMEEGCIIEYNYSIQSKSLFELANWFFQEEIPVRYSQLEVNFPETMAYSYLFQGNESMTREEDEKGNQIFTGKNGKITLESRKYTMENAPAMKPEGYITTMDDYRARIRFQLAEVKYSDGRIDKIMDTWKNAKNDLDHHPYFGEQYLKKSKYKDITERVVPLTNGLSTEKEKANFFYDFMLKNFTWNGNYRMGTRTEKLKDIFPLGKGSSGEINLMLLTMLRSAGLEAYPIITSTRSHGKMYEDYPLTDQFNHTMVYATIDGETVIMDAIDPLMPMGYPSPMALNGRGVVIRDKGTPEWVDIVPPKNANDIFMFKMEMDETGTCTGTFNGAYKGYNAIPERSQHLKNKDGSHWVERLSERFAEVQINNVRNGELENINATFFDTLDLKIENAAQFAGDFIYVSPVIYSAFLENPFKQKERNYPVDIPYPFGEQYFLELKIPDGYEIEELPKSASFSLPGNGGVFRFIVSEKEPGLISVNARFLMRQLKFYPQQYDGVKELFDLVAEKCGEQIVLRKKE